MGAANQLGRVRLDVRWILRRLMRREIRDPRPDWRRKVEALGFSFHTLEGAPYWNESAAYVFEREEIEVLESATNELHRMCLECVERVISEGEFARFGLPEAAWPVISQAWDDDPPAIYGRFDLAYDGLNPPKLLEYNADTPTSLLEAAVIQWHWLEEVAPEADQFNSIWEGLVEKWKGLREEGFLRSGLVHFACMDVPEDLMTTAVLMDTAHEAGLQVSLMGMPEVAWDHDALEFADPGGRTIQTLFKLYPWEWLLQEEFGRFALQSYRKHQWIEPIWKMILSNKAILPLLWEMFPDHENLLPAYVDGPRDLEEYVSKPVLGREGANVELHLRSGSTVVDGPYAGPRVWQQYQPLPCFDGNHAVVGSWVIDGEARGIGVRESDGPITEDHARFVPHYFR